eukprot:24237-Rhodomonas_salina.1
MIDLLAIHSSFHFPSECGREGNPASVTHVRTRKKERKACTSEASQSKDNYAPKRPVRAQAGSILLAAKCAL